MLGMLHYPPTFSRFILSHDPRPRVYSPRKETLAIAHIMKEGISRPFWDMRTHTLMLYCIVRVSVNVVFWPCLPACRAMRYLMPTISLDVQSTSSHREINDQTDPHTAVSIAWMRLLALSQGRIAADCCNIELCRTQAETPFLYSTFH